jgi:hypothetical protein
LKRLHSQVSTSVLEVPSASVAEIQCTMKATAETIFETKCEEIGREKLSMENQDIIKNSNMLEDIDADPSFPYINAKVVKYQTRLAREKTKRKFKELKSEKMLLVKKRKFEIVEDELIKTTFPYSYGNMCYFSLYFEPRTFEKTLMKVKALYLRKMLPGIKYLSYSNSLYQGYYSIYFYTGPNEEITFVRYVGHALVGKLKYKREKTNYSAEVQCLKTNKSLLLSVPYFGS